MLIGTDICADDSAATIHLRILATTDLHAHLLPYDYYLDVPAPQLGLAQTGTLIRNFRRAARNCLLFDNGDFLVGSPVHDQCFVELGKRPDAIPPILGAMNSLGYDAAALGNHEFNYGLGPLYEAQKRAKFPFLCANAQFPGHPDFPAYTILERDLSDDRGQPQRLKIGVLGLCPPQIANWDRHNLPEGTTTHGIVETATRLVPEIRQAGADIVIALCHSGLGAETAHPNLENALIPLAQTDGIDAIVGGHTHVVYPCPETAKGVAGPSGTIHGKPVVVPGFYGSHLGVIDIELKNDPAGWRPASHSVQAVPISAENERGVHSPLVNPDPQIIRSAIDLHNQTLRQIREPLGKTDTALQSYFALVRPDATLTVVANAQAATAKAALAKTAYGDLPLLSAAAPFRVGGRAGPTNYIDIPAGPLLMRHAAELYQYPNFVTVIEATGAILLEWLEKSAGIFNQLVDGVQDQSLINPDMPSYNFDVIFGLDYVIDPRKPARTFHTRQRNGFENSRIHDLRYKGRLVGPDDRFVVATNSYRLGGGGEFAMLAGCPVVYETRRSVREIVTKHLLDPRNEQMLPDAPWRFPVIHSTSATFESGPGALNYLTEINAPQIRHLGPAPHGFERFCFDFSQ